jgi:peptide/nickel transport system ATP-binding protein
MATPRPHRRDDRPPVLAIDNLQVEIAMQRGLARVVDSVSLEVWPNEIVGVIGESGSGKTMTALSVLGLLPRRATIAGEIKLTGQSLTTIGNSTSKVAR